ncbi:alpha/beta fold hydrolase [Streptomyces sp. AJS327]|uniref:alpha/beta fold hydrolase n=1 Tax=Streptomyces sp. AJS327 TaxID=2545265 RepID=UPI0015DF16CA|nr:alpha/beta hydrolase [Streptomyces sp. AJS327]
MGTGTGAFSGEAARARFMAAYDRALGRWPGEPEAVDLATSYGDSRVYRYPADADAATDREATPAVLLPGLNASPTVWAPHVAALGRDRVVYAPELLGEPGHSTQTTPLGTGDALAAWLDEVLDGLRVERAHLVGLSYGGWIACQQATRSPERVASLTLAEPAGVLAPLRPTFLLGTVAVMVCGVRGLQRRWFGRLIGETGERPEDFEAQLNLTVESLRSFRSRLPTPRRATEAELGGLTVPVLVLLVRGSRSTDARRAAERARHLVPDVRIKVLEGTGHGLPEGDVNRLVPAFLGEVEGVG